MEPKQVSIIVRVIIIEGCPLPEVPRYTFFHAVFNLITKENPLFFLENDRKKKLHFFCRFPEKKQRNLKKNLPFTPAPSYLIADLPHVRLSKLYIALAHT